MDVVTQVRSKTEITNRPYSGVFTPDDAAVFLRATTPPVRESLERWENQRKRFIGPGSRQIRNWIRRSAEAPLDDGRPLVLTFDQIIRARMIVLFRTRGISLKSILESEQFFRSITGKPQPFITEDFWSSSSDIFFEFEQRIRAATPPNQLVMDDVIREYMTPVHHGLEFGASGVSLLWRPMPGILIDPGVQFGAPCIEGTRIETESVWSFRESGTSPEELAALYKVERHKIDAAIAWEAALARAA